MMGSNYGNQVLQAGFTLGLGDPNDPRRAPQPPVNAPAFNTTSAPSTAQIPGAQALSPQPAQYMQQPQPATPGQANVPAGMADDDLGQQQQLPTGMSPAQLLKSLEGVYQQQPEPMSEFEFAQRMNAWERQRDQNGNQR